MQFVQGVIGILIGFAFIKYAFTIKQWSGSMGWAEKIFGIGGTTSAIKVIGILIIIFSFLWMTGTLGDVLRSTLGPLFGVRNETPIVQ